MGLLPNPYAVDGGGSAKSFPHPNNPAARFKADRSATSKGGAFPAPPPVNGTLAIASRLLLSPLAALMVSRTPTTA